MPQQPWPKLMYGTAWKEDDTKRCVLEALKAGFRAIDTANQRKHYHEEGVGQGLAQAYETLGLSRADLTLQTKFTYQNGQDHRLPYDVNADLPTQVSQSFASSLVHLKTDYLDSYVLHGPSHYHHWTGDDHQVWRAMEALHDAGKVRVLGVSNVRLQHLRTLCQEARVPPKFVQNRCITFKWDQEMRAFCDAQGIVYQGFNLTRNPIYDHPDFQAIVARTGKTPHQVIYHFAMKVGMLPLTGTTKFQHMKEALAAETLDLSPEECRQIEDIGATFPESF